MTQLGLDKKPSILLLVILLTGAATYASAGPLTVLSKSLYNANVGLTYKTTLTAAGGTAPYSWAITGGVLPAGLSMSASGVISGVPATIGTFSLTFMVLDSESPQQFASNTTALVVGHTFYVDSVSGSDSNSGAATSQPWKSLAKVGSTLLHPGDTILLKRGDVWNERLLVPGSGTATAPITIGAYGTGNAPLLDGTKTIVYGVVVNLRSYVKITNLAIQNFTGYGVDILSSPHTSVINCTFKNIANSAVNVAAGSPYALIDHNTDSDDPGVHSVSFLRFNTATSDNPVISNNTVGELGAHFGIVTVDGNNAKIFGNNLTGNGHDITIESATRNVTSGQIYDNVTTNCSTLEGDGECITLTGTNGFTVTVSIYRNFVKGGSHTANGIAGYHSVNSQIYDNVVLNAPLGSDFDFTNSSKNNVFYNNSAYSAMNNGFAFTGGSTGNVVKNNIVKMAGYDGVYADAQSIPVTEDYNILNQSGYLMVSTNLTRGPHTISSDPQFIATAPATANDVKLKAGSPAISSGVNLATPFNLRLDPSGTSMPYPAIDQNQFGPGWERGAFVFRP